MTEDQFALSWLNDENIEKIAIDH